MNENRIKFTADDGLLKQVITDQAGDWLKGILELMQNSYDSILMRDTPIKEPRIDIEILNDNGVHTLIVEDVGCGWGKKKADVIRNMQVFGDSIKKHVDGTIGEKGMGRGQAFAMIYDVTQDEFIGDIKVQTNGWEIYDIRLSDLSFSVRKVTKIGDKTIKRKGTRWIIQSTFRKFEENEIRKYVEENILLPVTITINGKPIKRGIGGWKNETDWAVYYLAQGKGGFRVYDRGLYVKTERLGGIGGTIITKVPLRLNFARNDILDSDPYWWKIWQEALNSVHNYIHDSNGVYTPEKKIAIKELIARQPNSIDDYQDAPIIQTSQGKFITPVEVNGKKVYLAEVGSRLADDVSQRGAIVIAEGYGELAKTSGANLESLDKSRDSIVESARRSRYISYGDFDLAINDKDRKYMEYLRELNNDRVLSFGKHKGFSAWTDGSHYIWFDITTFRRWTKGNPAKEIFYLRAISLFAHELAHDDDNRETDHHGYKFEEDWIDWMKKLMHQAEVVITTKKGVSS